MWRHTRRGDKYVTVIIDLTPVRDGTGPARLLDMVEARSKSAFKTWLAERPSAWRDAVEVVAMDGFTGFKTAAAEEVPDAVAVMDPFHVVRLAGDALDQCRSRVQLAIHGHRGFKDDPLYKSRRTLHTGAGLLLGTAIVAGGGVEGGVVAYQVGWVIFLAPYAVLAQPIHTAILPELVVEARDQGLAKVAASLRWALERMAVLVVPATWSTTDEEAVAAALAATQLTDIATRR